MRIKKRDGSLQEWDDNKIAKAMTGAFKDANEDLPKSWFILGDVYAHLGIDNHHSTEIIDIERVQDAVETVLMQQLPTVGKHYVLYREKRAKLRAERRKPDPKALADYIHVAKYARYSETAGRRETYEETVSRVKRMHGLKFPDLQKSINESFNLVREKKVLPSMRSMQFAGPAIEQHHARLYNCSFTLIDRPKAFSEAFYLLLCGCGVGYSVQWDHIRDLPALGRINARKVTHCRVNDSIEGWADAIEVLIKSFMNDGFSLIYEDFIEFDYSQIRPEGKPLDTSGGLAPGHLPLKRCIERVRALLSRAQGRKLRPIEVHDILCYIAEAVLAGGIRRSSLMCLFSEGDTEMMYAKTGNWFSENPQRAMANNSAVLLRSDNDEEKFKHIMELSQQFGEPGFFFSNSTHHGTNPCGEIGLEPTDYKTMNTGFAFCNLCEINVPACKTKDEFIAACRAAAFIGTLQASYTDFKYLSEASKEVAERDALLGVSLTGIQDAPDFIFDAELLAMGIDHIRKVNKDTAKIIGINPAARLTTIKPSGTASLELGGVGSGIHPHHARRYFRRVTANPLEPVAQFFIKHNPHMVEKKPNGDLALVFPTEAPEGARLVKEYPAIAFLEDINFMYINWVHSGTNSGDLTHNVSCTVTMKEEERENIEYLVWLSRKRIAAMSFVPPTIDKLYAHAPREAVETEADEQRWNYLISNYKPVPWTELKEDARTVPARSLEAACVGGVCEI